ncbi:hypothetical protein KAM351_45540 [Aeromonas caviae]|uniref:Uncharacterized protein n=1 Tax=Aeromonas caviae TaxID=648 RepID=A0AA37D348_AERCA|nr:hypothetical protein KAM351_45540 [Aeromonas caviae]
MHTLRGGQNWTLKTPETWSFLRADQHPDVELGVSEQAVHLFHRMFALETIGQGETIPDGVDGQRTGFDNPEGCIGQGKNTLGMHVLSKYLVDVVED